MHVSYPGFWMPDEELEELSASELLMLVGIFSRAEHRADVGLVNGLRVGPSYEDLRAELTSVHNWVKLELAARLMAYTKAEGFLMHIGSKNDAYWRVPDAPE